MPKKFLGLAASFGWGGADATTPTYPCRCMNGCSDGCPNLEHVDISWCQRILDDGLEAVATGCGHLKVLICKGCSGITDEGLGHIAQHCHDLRVLNLHSCSV